MAIALFRVCGISAVNDVSVGTCPLASGLRK